MTISSSNCIVIKQKQKTHRISSAGHFASQTKNAGSAARAPVSPPRGMTLTPRRADAQVQTHGEGGWRVSVSECSGAVVLTQLVLQRSRSANSHPKQAISDYMWCMWLLLRLHIYTLWVEMVTSIVHNIYFTQLEQLMGQEIITWYLLVGYEGCKNCPKR